MIYVSDLLMGKLCLSTSWGTEAATHLKKHNPQLEDAIARYVLCGNSPQELADAQYICLLTYQALVKACESQKLNGTNLSLQFPIVSRIARDNVTRNLSLKRGDSSEIKFESYRQNQVLWYDILRMIKNCKTQDKSYLLNGFALVYGLVAEQYKLDALSN